MNKNLIVSGILFTAITVAISCVAHSGGYKRGYTDAREDSDKSWQVTLIDADYAEYDRKTGKWKLRTMEDVLMTGAVLGRMKPDGWFPEPEVEPSEVKQKLKTMKKS